MIICIIYMIIVSRGYAPIVICTDRYSKQEGVGSRGGATPRLVENMVGSAVGC